MEIELGCRVVGSDSQSEDRKRYSRRQLRFAAFDSKQSALRYSEGTRWRDGVERGHGRFQRRLRRGAQCRSIQRFPNAAESEIELPETGVQDLPAAANAERCHCAGLRRVDARERR